MIILAVTAAVCVDVSKIVEQFQHTNLLHADASQLMAPVHPCQRGRELKSASMLDTSMSMSFILCGYRISDRAC